MSGQMSQQEWKKFCDPSKKPEIFAYLKASGKDFEQTRTEFNKRVSGETAVARINLFLYGCAVLNVAVGFLGSVPNFLCAVGCLVIGTSLQSTRGNTKKSLKKKASIYKETGQYRPY